MSDDSKPLSPGYIRLLNETFHASIALLYTGLGVVVGSTVARGEPNGKLFAAILGLGLFFLGAVWLLVNNARSRGR